MIDIDLDDLPDPPKRYPSMCQVKIVSDGTPHGTFLINKATGEHIANVLSLDLSLVPGEPCKCVIAIHSPELDITTPSEIVMRE